ncbi:MAG: prephenate dehydrogenase/arogenate dehydrogenase family protein, partial [Chloroflexi bacterium]
TIFLSSKEHDQIAAVVSHIPQIMAVTMMNYAAKLNHDNPAYLKLGAGGFRDMTRIASSPFTIWKEILQTNYQNISFGLEQLIQELQKMKDLLSEPKMEQLFDEAAKNRLSIPKDSRGFLRPNFDIFVVVEDKAGVIAEIANILSAENINIKDIEVVKVREGNAGTMRLSLETERDRENAILLLNKNGFETQIKY